MPAARLGVERVPQGAHKVTQAGGGLRAPPSWARMSLAKDRSMRNCGDASEHAPPGGISERLSLTATMPG